MGYIDDDQLAERAHALLESGYGSYLLQLLEQR
jgi:glucose-1-phosphate thymidylyltransferase